MSGYSWTLPGVTLGSQGIGAAERASQYDRLWGKDIWLDVRDGAANLEVTPSGDWLLASGAVALRQAINRRILTDPGEWATLPNYGVGARSFVKARRTRAAMDELIERIRGQLVQDPRVEDVAGVVIDDATPDQLTISVWILAKGRSRQTEMVRASVEVS